MFELGFVFGGVSCVLKNRDLGKATSVRRWTQTAIDCYKRGCVCSGCFYYDFFKESPQKCQMKATVLELVRVLGRPNVEPVQSTLVEPAVTTL
jgi:hypothetical protein